MLFFLLVCRRRSTETGIWQNERTVSDDIIAKDRRPTTPTNEQKSPFFSSKETCTPQPSSQVMNMTSLMTNMQIYIDGYRGTACVRRGSSSERDTTLIPVGHWKKGVLRVVEDGGGWTASLFSVRGCALFVCDLLALSVLLFSVFRVLCGLCTLCSLRC